MSSVVFKLKFKHPNLTSTKGKNLGHIVYIATRSGVDMKNINNSLEKELDKEIFLDDKEIKFEIQEVEKDDYIKYINERPRSHGLFDENGVADYEGIKKEIYNHNSFVWRGIISLREHEAEPLGYLDKEKWSDMLNKKMPDMAKEMGIPLNNMRWCGAFHKEEGHPHCHIVFWEKKPVKVLGVQPTKVLENIRKLLTDEIFEEYRLENLNCKNIERDYINEMVEKDMGNISFIRKDLDLTVDDLSNNLVDGKLIEKFNPKLYPEVEYELLLKTFELSQMLPNTGRVAYAFMPEDVKEKTDEITNFILNQDSYEGTLARYLETVENATKLYTGKLSDLERTKENALLDIRKRVGQIVLRGAVDLNRKDYRSLNLNKSMKAYEYFDTYSKGIDISKEYEDFIRKRVSYLLKTNSREDVEKILKETLNNKEFESLDLKEILDVEEREIKQNFLFSFKKNKENIYEALILKKDMNPEKVMIEMEKLILKEQEEIVNELSLLRNKGFLKEDIFSYDIEKLNLTNNGIKEFLTIKDLDLVEKELFEHLEKEDPVTIESLLENKNIKNNIFDREYKPFRLVRFDLKIRELFGENNKLEEANLEEKFQEFNKEYNEKNLKYIKDRIVLLKNNGFLTERKGILSFESNVEEYFQNNDNGWHFSEKLPYKKDLAGFKFSKYDIDTIFKYIENNQDLTKEGIREIVFKEIENESADLFKNKIINYMEDRDFQKTFNEYIKEDISGNLELTTKGLSLLNETPNKDIVLDIQQFCQIISKEEVFNKNDMEDIFKKHILNEKADKQYQYLSWRLKNLIKEKLVQEKDGVLQKTIKGEVAEEKITNPEKGFLLKKLNYLERLGLVELKNDVVELGKNYKKWSNDLNKNKIEKTKRESTVFSNEYKKIIEKNFGNIYIEELQKTAMKDSRSYINDKENEKVENNKELIGKIISGDINGSTPRKSLVKNISKVFLMNGVQEEELKDKVFKWCEINEVGFSKEKINEITENVLGEFKSNQRLKKEMKITPKEWEEMNSILKDIKPPEYIYDSFSVNKPLLIMRKVWGGVMGEFIKQENQAQQKGLYALKALSRGLNSKSAKKEMARKMKDGQISMGED